VEGLGIFFLWIDSGFFPCKILFNGEVWVHIKVIGIKLFYVNN